MEHLKNRSLSKPDRIKALIDQKIGKITKKEIMDTCPDISKTTIERALEECVFIPGAGCPVWEIWRRFDFGSFGSEMGLEKDEGMEVISEAWGCLCSVPSARILWLPQF